MKQKQAKEIAKRFISAMYVCYDGFWSNELSLKDNVKVQKEIMAIAHKLYDGKNSSNIDEIVRSVLSKDNSNA